MLEDTKKHRLVVMNETGDEVRVRWNPKNPWETQDAKNQFEELKKKGYVAFRLKREGDSKGEQMKEFDPLAERILMSKMLVGG